MKIKPRTFLLSGYYCDTIAENFDLSKLQRLTLESTNEIRFLKRHGKHLVNLRVLKIDFQTELYFSEFLNLQLEKKLPKASKLAKLTLSFNSLKVNMPTPLSDIITSIKAKKTIYKLPYSLENH